MKSLGSVVHRKRSALGWISSAWDLAEEVRGELHRNRKHSTAGFNGVVG